MLSISPRIRAVCAARDEGAKSAPPCGRRVQAEWTPQKWRVAARVFAAKKQPRARRPRRSTASHVLLIDNLPRLGGGSFGGIFCKDNLF